MALKSYSRKDENGTQDILVSLTLRVLCKGLRPFGLYYTTKLEPIVPVIDTKDRKLDE